MRHPTHNTAKLPRKLLEELDVADDHVANHGKRTGPSLRKERRKAARVEKKTKPSPARKILATVRSTQPSSNHKREAMIIDEPPSGISRGKIRHKNEQPGFSKSILKKAKSKAISEFASRGHVSLSSSPPPPPPQPEISRGTKERLLADDAEIAALEKALGLKASKGLPKSFTDDGLDTLLDGLDDPQGTEEILPGKRKRSDGEDWLNKKRHKAQDDTSPARKSNEDGAPKLDTAEWREGSSTDGSQEDSEEGDDFNFSDGYSLSPASEPETRKFRENPYIAPMTASDDVATTKYVPPSLRNKNIAVAEDLSPLRRQLQGLLNRLSEDNIVSILGDVERLYQNNARQHVSTTLLNLLMGLLSDPASLQDTFIILHAGFIAAIYKIIGTDFGAQAIHRIDEEFAEHFPFEAKIDSHGKRSTNLVSLLAELYNFQIISSNLIYDFIRLFLEDLSETSTELILKIMRNSGPQLRQDDASSLKDIVLLLQSAVAKKGEDNLSVRAKFMIETINNLKNNRMKTSIATSTIASEHTIRMKKTLGTLNTRTVRASEPLRIGLKDLRESNKRGKWWLVGASYKDESPDQRAETKQNKKSTSISQDPGFIDSTSTDLVQLAREQRMNTDVRRSIFIAIMSATDYKDAYLRLQKLRLKKAQELEIPKVIIHCAGAEEVYNPFYSLIARRVCSERKLKMAFQFSLWDLFRRMGEGKNDGSDGSDDSDDSDGDALSLRSLVNLAKLFGVLIAEGGLKISVLKTLNFAYLQPKTRTFVELLLITVILHSQQGKDTKRDEKSIMELFLLSKNIPNLARGLQYFLKKVVSKTDVAGSKQDRETVKWGCRVAGDALKVVASSMVTDE